MATLKSVHGRPANGLNVYVTVVKPLQAPVTGLLGRTYPKVGNARAAGNLLTAAILG